MKSRFVFFVLVTLAFGGGQAMAQAAPRIAQFNSNAGTGPYLFGPLTGFTGAGPRFDGAFALLPKIYDLLVSKDTRTKFNGTIAIFNDSFEQAFNGQKDLLDKYRILYGDLKSYYAIKDYKNALVKLQEITRLMLPQIEKEPIVGMANVKSGVFFRSNSTYQFNSFIVTSDERGTDHHKTDTFVTGGVFFPLRGQSGQPTERIGVGAAFGDPEHFVWWVSGGTYLSPNAFDLSAGMSFSLTSLKNRDDNLNRRNLMDHIRPGEMWFTVDGRQISSSGSQQLLPNGTIGEAELTFALKDTFRYSVAATTISLSGIYCANKNLGIDELGADFRTPLSTGKSPVFFSARYGTRGHYTLSLNWKL